MEGIDITKIMHYVSYLIISITLFVCYIQIYFKITRYNDLEMIKSGNMAVAYLVSGVSLGYVVNIAFACFYSYSIISFVVYSLISGGLQLLVQLIVEKMFSGFYDEIENNNMAVGIVFSIFAVCVGILNGASAY